MKRKIICRYIIFLFLFFTKEQALAQGNEPLKNNDWYSKIADTTAPLFTAGRPYYIAAGKMEIPKSVKLIRQLDASTAIIEINSPEVFNALKQQATMTAANDLWKYSSFAEQHINEKKKEEQAFILSATDLPALLNVIKKLKDTVTVLSMDEPSHSIVVKTTSTILINKLLPLKEVIFIDIRAAPHSETSIIGYNRSFHGINAIDYSIPGANGKNIVAGVKEQKMQDADIDLYKRVLPSSIATANITNHSTVISSIIGGAGNSFYDGRGIANGCHFFSSSFDNLFADDAIVLNTNKVTVQNHSYGTVIQQFYGAEAVSYDAQTWNNKNMLHVFSAGNRGADAATDGRYSNLPGFANLTGNFKTAKNSITVGAIDNKGNIPAESSAGPLYDGRIAPQLIALGPNGTSDAAAIVSGTIAVVQQVYADSNSNVIPPASLTKAILYNTAEDIYNTGIDYKTGYGLLNSFATVKAIQQKKYDGSNLAQGQQWTKNITVPANTAQLKITLAWTDSTASVNNNKALLNDLDLEVQEISSGTIYKPWVLSTAAHIDSLNKGSVRKRDSLNTAEQVSIALPAAGVYQVKVTGTNIITSSLPFHIAFHTDTLNTFSFTNPQHASDVNREESPNLAIKWKTFVADTNTTGNLFISYNSGANWQLLKAAHKIYINQYHWPIKDTSTAALLKMETPFGDYFSKTFIISPVTRPNVDFLCVDSFRLSWNKHIYATGYKIFTLADSAYLKPIITVTDTFIVMNRTAYPSLVYAVEPVLNNGLPAARSIASDITQQGVKCFYKTFYYNLLDGNQLDLVLELSIASYADSVNFENVTANGQLLRSYGSAAVTASNRIYHQLVNTLTAGTTYLRARIKLKSGQTVFSEIIAVLTSGKQYILFYPNPARRNGELKYMLQQGIPTDSRLRIFDISGRLLKYYNEMPNTINIDGLAPGLFIYQLFNSSGVLLETGKLVVQ
jgi:Subtilase family